MPRDIDPELWRRVEPILDQALELAPEERDTYLDRACGDDAELRAEVEALLAEDAREGGPLATDATPDAHLDATLDEVTPLEKPPAPRDPETIGPFRILSRLGAGGMGVVYLAEQTEPLRRKVALKIIRRGMDTEEIVRRFEAERQALALMDHPHIAKIFDAGTTEDNRPYFVMEHVAGYPITEHCDRHGLGTRKRLQLFLTVCEAVQHAHRRGVLHRDIKPSNVLVATDDGRPSVKVIDFGIAKAIEDPLTAKTLFTQHGQLVGTPEYMSPEQADAMPLDLDTRTDVYSLGVLLYELLTGMLPFDPAELRRAGYEEMRRILRETDPPRPSERLLTLRGAQSTSVSRSHSSDPGTLRREIQGDLDWIVMRSLEKDRNRRYGSTSELAGEIERHLTHRPVQAGPPGAAYQARKFLRRHRAGVAFAAIVAVALLVALSSVTWTLVQSNRQRARTEAALSESREVTEFLADMFHSSNPRSKGRDVTVVEVLEKAVEDIDGRFTDAPRVEARLRLSIGQTYFNLGDYEQARKQLERARELIGDDEQAEPETRVLILGQLADVISGEGDYDGAEEVLVASRELAERTLGMGHGTTIQLLNNLAVLRRKQGRYDDAILLYEEAIRRSVANFGSDDYVTVRAQANLANVYRSAGRLEDSQRLFEHVIPAGEELFGEDHPEMMAYRNNFAGLLESMDRFPEAIPIYEKNAEQARTALGEEHPWRLTFLNNLAMARYRVGELERAEADLRSLHQVQEKKLGLEHPSSLSTLHNLATVVESRGDVEAAEPLRIRAFEGRKAVLGDAHPRTLQSRAALAGLWIDMERFDEAERLLRDAPASQADSEKIQEELARLEAALQP